MISSIEWVPAGVADPVPKKYEFSQAELDLIQMMESHTVGEGGAENTKSETNKATKSEPTKPKTNTTKLPLITENNLPADLRMDEYSSDEEDDQVARGVAIGSLLVEGDKNENVKKQTTEEPQNDVTAMENDDDNDNDGDDNDNDNDDSDDSDESDSDDDLADVPDTREYMPIDLDGLNAIGFSHVGTNAPAYLEDDDEVDSDVEDDVRIRGSDSIVVMAKTEEVRAMCVVCDCEFTNLEFGRPACIVSL